MSLQNVDAANAFRPDGTQDQTVDFLASAPTASTWYTTGNLSADRTLAHGELVAAVLEFQTRLGSDAFNVQSVSSPSASFIGNSGMTHFFSSAWNSLSLKSNIILEGSDGSFGTLSEAIPLNAVIQTGAFNTGTSPDEVALRFAVDFPCKINGAWVAASNAAAGRNFDIVLYEGTTALETVSIDAEYLAGFTAKLIEVYFGERELTVGTEYFLSVKPTTASTISAYSFSVAAAGHLDVHEGGQAFHYGERTDAGSWSKTTTKRLWGGLHISALSDGAGGGGGLIVHPGMRGGFV
jgi:hypothetical protein